MYYRLHSPWPAATILGHKRPRGVWSPSPAWRPPGRVSGTEWLEPKTDAFRNYRSEAVEGPTEHRMIDRAQLLGLSAPEMTALLGGLRVLAIDVDDAGHGVLTDRPGTLSNDFFVNLLDMGTTWKPRGDGTYQGSDRSTGAPRWTATRVDLVFGSNSQLRALSEVYASDDGEEQLVEDFVAAWNRVMEADRFDLR